MPAVKTGFTPPPMPGMPAPMQPMGGVPPMQNPFAPMPPLPLAGMPPPPMPMPQGQPMPQTAQGQPMMGSTAGRRRRFGDALEGMLGRNQGIGAVPQRPLPMPPMMPQQRMVAPNTPMMRTPPMQSMTARPMAMGGEVDIFGYEDGGPVVQGYKPGGEVSAMSLRDQMLDAVEKNSNAELAGDYTKQIKQLFQDYADRAPGTYEENRDALKAFKAEHARLKSLQQEAANRGIVTGRDIFNPERFLNKPRLDEFAEAAGISFNEAANAMRSEIGENTDARDWSAIMASDNPYQAAMDAKQAQIEAFDPRHFREVVLERAATNPFGDAAAGSKYLLNLDEKTSNYLTNKLTSTPRELRTAERIMGYNPETGMTDVAVYYKNPNTTTPYIDKHRFIFENQPYKFPSGNFDPGALENLPNYPAEFKSVSGSLPTVQDFADYGYTDPEASFEGIYGAEGVDLVGSVDSVLSTDPAVYAGDVIGSGVNTSLYSQSPLFSSPEIGEINLPERPADLNIFDYLSEPTYGSFPVYGMADGGSVQSYQPSGEVSAMDLRDKLLAATSGDSGTVSGSDEVSSVQPSNLESTSDAAAGEIYFEDLSPLRQQMMQDIISKTEKNLGQTIGETAEYYDQEAVDDKTRKLNRFKRMLEGDQALSEGMLMGINMKAKDALEDDFKALFQDPSYESIYDHYSHPYSEAFDLLNIVEFNNSRDPRDWEKIMASSDPIAAARLATKQAIEAGAFSKNPKPSYMTSSGYVNPNNILGQVGPVMLYRDKKGRERFRITDPSESTPIRFTDLGYTPETAMQRLQRFGYGLSQDQIDQLRELAYENYGPDSANPLGAGSGIFQVVDNITPFGQYSPELLAQNFLATGVDPNVYKNVEWQGPQAYKAAEEQKAYERMLKEQGLPLTQPSSGTPTQMSSGIAIPLPSLSTFDQQVSSSTPSTVSYSQSPLFSSSEIGAINLPSAPSELDIFDYLGDPTYGSLLDKQIYGMRDGGAVPRQTMIGDQPHMLAYINPQEADLLKDLGGSGEPGPGGIPAYDWSWSESSWNPKNWGGGGNDNSSSASTNNDDSGGGKFEDSRSDLESAGYTVSDDGNAVYSSTGQVAGANWSGSGTVNSIVESNQNNSSDDNVTARVSGMSSGRGRNLDADLGIGMSSNTVTADQLSSGEGTTTYDTGGGGSVTVATGSSIDDILSSASSDDGGSSVMDVIAPSSVYTPPAPTYTDRFGRKYRSQAEADAADRAFAAQLASYGSGKVGFDRFKADAAATFPGRSREETDRMAARAYPDFVEDYSRDINIFDPAPFSYTGIGGIGAGPEGGSLGITPAPITTSDISTDVSRLNVGPAGPSDIEADLFGTGLGSDILSLDTPSAATMYPYDVPASVLADQLRGGPLTPGMIPPDDSVSRPAVDQPLTDDDMGLPSGPVTDLQRGLGRIAARDADMDPFGTGTQVSLQDVKDRVARAEGTADEGGYGRLLGNQEGRFGVDLTDMTVQEVLDFQKQRGPGSYAEYSQGVNKQRGMTRADGSGVISTPAGKYQVVGATLEDLIDKGVVDPNAKFDEGTQEKIGSYLIAERRGLNDLQAGNITREQFEENLGKEFEGIKRGLDKGAGSTSAVIAAASETGKQAEVDRRDENVEKIKAQIGDQADPTGVESFFYNVIGQLGLGLGKPLADKLRGASREERQAIIDQHLYALQNGATPKTDEEGNYIGFDISTMDTFADKVLGAEDISTFLPGGAEDADGDGVPDYVRFGQVYDAQSTAANIDPYGMSTEQGFITSDGREFFVDATGNVVEITDGVVPFEVGGGDDAAAAFGVTETTTGGDDEAVKEKNHVDGVCNNPDYVYNPETDMCEPPAEEEGSDTVSSPITTAITPRSFDEVLRSVVVPAPDIAPISANIRPMQGGGMAGLNRAADNFLKALAG